MLLARRKVKADFTQMRNQLCESVSGRVLRERQRQARDEVQGLGAIERSPFGFWLGLRQRPVCRGLAVRALEFGQLLSACGLGACLTGTYLLCVMREMLSR